MLNDLMAGYLRRGPLGRRQKVQFEPMAPYGVPGQPGTTGGYDSSGINPYGMYTGGQLPGMLGQLGGFPRNPGGFRFG